MSFLDAGEEAADEGAGEGDDPNVVSYNLSSTCLANLTFHRDTGELYMTFTDGSKYVIASFPEIELERWVRSDSVGGYFNNFVRGNY